MTSPGAKYDAAKNYQRMADEIKRLREEFEESLERLAQAQLTIGQQSHTIARLRGLLARLEWAGGPHGGDRCCPDCKEYEDQGHAGCELAEELRR